MNVIVSLRARPLHSGNEAIELGLIDAEVYFVVPWNHSVVEIGPEERSGAHVMGDVEAFQCPYENPQSSKQNGLLFRVDERSEVSNNVEDRWLQAVVRAEKNEIARRGFIDGIFGHTVTTSTRRNPDMVDDCKQEVQLFL